jgi:hypothetical protein
VFKATFSNISSASKTEVPRVLVNLFEKNAFQRLAEISTSLNDVFALTNSQQIWAVGNAGFIIHSTDGGES